MEIDDDTEDYLLGSELSNGRKFPVKWKPCIQRNRLLSALVKNKRVLHIGCADHVSLIHKKRSKGLYLHSILLESAGLLVGADINIEAIEEMRDYGFSNLYSIDEIPGHLEFDYALVPDVIEHVGNVEEFLKDLKKYRAKRFVLTTPNAYRLANRLLFRNELINTDHRCWFSPYTLAKAVRNAGFVIDEFHYTDRLAFSRPIGNIFRLLFPLCRDGLAVVLRRKEGHAD